jgi:hypothetical protein
MTGPGRYGPDPTEGITRVEDLPKAKILRRQRSFKRRKCPHCGHSAYRDKVFTRTLHDLGDLAANRPRDLVITYSQHCCSRCRKYFNADLSDLAAPSSLYTHRVVAPWRPVGIFGATTASSFPLPRSRTGWRRGEKRAEARITRDYLDTALTDFSGYIAADELYDGPYCVLSIVDNRRFKRLLYEVLDHNPTEEDILRFFRRFHEALTGRGLKIRGVTTDGSPLYPKTVAEVFGPVEHQLCQFHVLAELTKAVLKAVTKVRRGLKGALPKFGRGRPSRANRRRAARKKRIEKKIADLFEHRYLLVQHHLTVAQEKTLRRITRGQSVLRSLREIMDEVYRLFDRRCRTDTALAKLARLRRRVARFKGLRQTLGKLFSPNLEKALTFLDDSLLPATSNAVERGNRRHRKMQKTVYRVRTAPHISRRIAADMLRDAQAEGRLQTTHTLHLARAG